MTEQPAQRPAYTSSTAPAGSREKDLDLIEQALAAGIHPAMIRRHRQGAKNGNMKARRRRSRTYADPTAQTAVRNVTREGK